MNSRLAFGLILLSAALGSTVLARGQDVNGVAWDWSHQHLVFSNPGTADDAIQKGTYEHWFGISSDPRYTMQQAKRRANAAAGFGQRSDLARQSDAGLPPQEENDATSYTPPDMTLEQRQALQSGSRNLPLGLVRAIVPPPAGERNRDGFAAIGSRGQKSSPNLIQKDWSETLGSSGAVGLGQYPATFTTSADSCSDFVVFNTGLLGSASQASIIAFNNIYATCNGGTPTVYWAYNTSGTIGTSVALSLDGSQVAFVQSSSTGVASLVLLKWAASSGTLTSPASPASKAATSYDGCTAPCMTSLTFNGSHNDTYSAPFIAYDSGAIYVGDDSGILHKFTNIFSASGTPGEVTSGGWPATVNSNASLAGPVYDVSSAKVFVGDYLSGSSSPCEPSSTSTNNPCGYLYSVSSTGSVIKSAQLDHNSGIMDAPIVDSTAGQVFVFAGDDGSTNCTGSAPCAGVFQFATGFTGGGSGIEATVGAGYEFMMAGTFDNTYITSPAGTGHLYVVGNTGAANNALYQVPISNGVMATSSTSGPVVSTNYTNDIYSAGLPVTEFYTGANDYIFLSVLSYGAFTASNECGTASLASGCVMGFNVSSGTVSSGTTPTGATAEAGGTSGIVVDNASSGAQNIYFSTLLNQTCTTSGGTGGCAIQTVQSAP